MSSVGNIQIKSKSKEPQYGPTGYEIIVFDNINGGAAHKYKIDFLDMTDDEVTKIFLEHLDGTAINL
jgi:hypothetical protein